MFACCVLRAACVCDAMRCDGWQDALLAERDELQRQLTLARARPSPSRSTAAGGGGATDSRLLNALQTQLQALSASHSRTESELRALRESHGAVEAALKERTAERDSAQNERLRATEAEAAKAAATQRIAQVCCCAVLCCTLCAVCCVVLIVYCVCSWRQT